jgi:MFS family permease
VSSRTRARKRPALFRPTSIEADLSKSAHVRALVKHAEQTTSLGRIEPVTNTRLQDAPRYQWVVLSNTTLGSFIASVNSNIIVIALAAIFAGIGVEPLAPGETNYFLWMLLGFLLVTSTLLVTFGRLSDMFGRVRLYNVGFAIFTLGSILLYLVPATGTSGNAAALELVMLRLVQGLEPGFLLPTALRLSRTHSPSSSAAWQWASTRCGVSREASLV